MNKPNNQLVLSALGKDRPGLVDELTGAVFASRCSIADSRMTVLGGEFAILLLIEGPWNQLAKLENQLAELERRLGLTIISKRTEPAPDQAAGLSYLVDVVALDHPGIVHKLSGFFSRRQINIIDLMTKTYAAPHTGTPMFSVQMHINIPADLNIRELREDFLEYCDEFNLDATLEPYKHD